MLLGTLSSELGELDFLLERGVVRLCSREGFAYSVGGIALSFFSVVLRGRRAVVRASREDRRRVPAALRRRLARAARRAWCQARRG